MPAPSTEMGGVGILVMIAIMLIAGFYIMTLLVRRRDITWNLNKTYSVLLMALMGGIAEVFLMTHIGVAGAVAVGIMALASVWLIVAIRGQYYIGGREYLKAMIEHHGMAVVMSQRLLAKAPRPDIAALAANIVRAQEAEIRLMRSMLRGEQSLAAVQAVIGSAGQ
jgi:hypothetical protein